MSSKTMLQLIQNYARVHRCVPSYMRIICFQPINNIHMCHKLSKSVKQASTKVEKTFYSRLKQTGYSYITDSSCAESIAYHVSHEWKDGYIFEADPGLGVLSKAILNTSVQHLRIFEKHPEFLTALKALKKDHDNLEIVEVDLLSLPSLVTKSIHNSSNELEEIFNGVKEHPWKDGVPFRIFSTISSRKGIRFLRFLLVAILDHSSVFSYGRCEFIVLVNEREYKYMLADAKLNYSTYRWATVLYNLYFDIKCLEKFSSEILFPCPSKKGNKEGQSFYLLKLTPNPNLFSSVVHENRHKEFYFFIRHTLAKRSNLVIPSLECWIPFCGPRLIKQGMKVFTKFGELDPNQLVQLFNQFSSWPEYENSTFHFAMREFFRKKNFNPSFFEEEEDLT